MADDNEEYDNNNNEEQNNEEQNNEEQNNEEQNNEEQNNEKNEEQQNNEEEQQNNEEEQQNEEKEQPQPPQQQQQPANYGSVDKPESLKQAWDIICKDNPGFNWYTAVHKDPKLKSATLVIDNNGKGGLNEIVEYLKTKNDKIVFGLLRVNTYDDSNSVRAKFIWVKFIGTKVGFMLKAKLTPQLGKIAEEFPVKHLSKDLDETCHQFDPLNLSKDFLKFGGAHKPNRYEYGPDQIYNVKK